MDFERGVYVFHNVGVAEGLQVWGMSHPVDIPNPLEVEERACLALPVLPKTPTDVVKSFYIRIWRLRRLKFDEKKVLMFVE